MTSATSAAWTSIPARRVLRRVDRGFERGAETVTAFRDGQVVARSRRRTEGFTESTKDIGYQGVRPGDLVVHSMDGFAGAIGVSESAGKMSPVVHIYSGDAATDLRFVAYYLRHLAAHGFIQALAKGIRERSTSFDPATLNDLPVPRPPLGYQQRIADFLDDQVDRINNVVAARSRQSDALEATVEEDLAARWEALRRAHGTARLAYLIRGMEQGWSPDAEAREAAAGEWAVMRAGCVNGGRFNAQDNKALPSGLEPRRQYEIRPGDLLMSRASGSRDLIGSVAVVDADVRERLLLPDKIYRLFPDRTGASAEYLAMMLRSRAARQGIVAGISGAEGMANNLPASVVRSIPVPWVPRPMQDALVVDYESRREDVASQRVDLAASVRLLDELKRSLITAAVTGEFDVSSADGSRVPIPN